MQLRVVKRSHPKAFPTPKSRAQSQQLAHNSMHHAWRFLTALLHDGCRRGSDALLGRQAHTQRAQLCSLPHVQLCHSISV